VRRRWTLGKRARRNSASSTGIIRHADGGGVGTRVGGIISAVVVTVTVEVAFPPAAGVTEAGDGVQVERAGAPEQATLTA
jgi:hypothetical protein